MCAKKVGMTDYEEPPWGGPFAFKGDGYEFQVIKEGIILPSVKIPLGHAGKSFIRLGRAPENDIILDHESISRFHVILQCHKETGQLHLYDLKSTHKTYLNKKALVPHAFTLLKPGDFLKFGASTRAYILQGNECLYTDKDDAILDGKQATYNVDANEASAKRKRKRQTRKSVKEFFDSMNIRVEFKFNFTKGPSFDIAEWKMPVSIRDEFFSSSYDSDATTPFIDSIIRVEATEEGASRSDLEDLLFDKIWHYLVEFGHVSILDAAEKDSDIELAEREQRLFYLNKENENEADEFYDQTKKNVALKSHAKSSPMKSRDALACLRYEIIDELGISLPDLDSCLPALENLCTDTNIPDTSKRNIRSFIQSLESFLMGEPTLDADKRDPVPLNDTCVVASEPSESLPSDEENFRISLPTSFKKSRHA